LRAVQEKAEQEDEAKIVDAMITAAMKGERAVLGVSDTLGAVQQGRVYRWSLREIFMSKERNATRAACWSLMLLRSARSARASSSRRLT